jgi:hypothetical protein
LNVKVMGLAELVANAIVPRKNGDAHKTVN